MWLLMVNLIADTSLGGEYTWLIRLGSDSNLYNSGTFEDIVGPIVDVQMLLRVAKRCNAKGTIFL